MAIHVFSSTSLDVLADELARSLGRSKGDPFSAPLILTPNMPVQRWIAYALADRRGIAANLQFEFFEEGLWVCAERSSSGDPSLSALPAQRLKREWVQWMIVAVLLSADAGEEELAPLFAYTGPLADSGDRAALRKLWQLSEQVSRLFREYQNAAPDLVQGWLTADRVPPKAAPMWKAQRALYRHLFGSGSVRDRIARVLQARHLTAAEFVNERLRQKQDGTAASEVLRLFCIPAIGPAQMRLLEMLGQRTRIEIYHHDVLAGLPSEAPHEEQTEPAPLEALVRRWGLAHAPRRDWLAQFEITKLPETPRAGPASRLAALQQMLRGGSAELPPDDDALQLLACPGVRREVEAVRDGVVHLLETEPGLQLTDIAILVPDMTRYRSHLEAVFQRDDVRVPFNLSDTTAEDDSVFAQGVEALLALAGGNFTRREFFNLVLNPCFLSAQKLSRDDAMQWLDWADRLNIFREFDAGARNDLRPFSWRHALRRLRLGRIMACGAGVQAYQEAVPFGDLRSSSPESVTAFSAVVERLAKFCERCAVPRSAGEWSTLLLDAFAEFVAVPGDRQEEEPVRRELCRAIEEFRAMDAMLAACGRTRKTLAFGLLRELVSSSIADISSRVGHYMLGGVTISALRPDRPIPFRAAFVLGMSEGEFPGRETPVSLDVRDPLDRTARLPSAVEANRAALLDVLLSTRERIVFSYVARNLQKDEVFEPATPLKEMEEALPFARLVRTEIPFTGASEQYVLGGAGASDLPCYHRQDLLHALSRLARDAALPNALSEADRDRFERLKAQAREALELRRFEAPRADAGGGDAEPTVSIEELTRFIRDPLAERLRRHLGLFDDDREDTRALEEHEPFHLDGRESGKLIRDALEAAVVKGGSETAIPSSAAQAVQRQFREQQWLGGAPSGEYGRLDRARIEEAITTTVEKPYVCERLTRLKRIAGVTIGRRVQTEGAVVFPTLRLKLGDGRVVRVTGQMPHVYQSRIGGPLEFFAVTNAQHKSRVPSSYLLQQWLFFVALSAGGEAGALGRTSRQWMGELGCKAWLLTANGLLGWRYAMQSQEAAVEYLAKLAAAYLDTSRFENLPLEIVLRIFEKEVGGHTAPPPDFSQRVQRELDRSEESDYGFSQAPFYSMLRISVPPDAIAVFFERIAPFMNGVTLDAQTDLAELDSVDDAGAEERE